MDGSYVKQVHVTRDMFNPPCTELFSLNKTSVALTVMMTRMDSHLHWRKPAARRELLIEAFWNSGQCRISQRPVVVCQKTFKETFIQWWVSKSSH